MVAAAFGSFFYLLFFAPCVAWSNVKHEYRMKELKSLNKPKEKQCRMPELPDCNVCGTRLKLILNKQLTWGLDCYKKLDKIDIFCSCGEGGGQALIKDLTSEQQQFFEALQEHIHKPKENSAPNR